MINQLLLAVTLCVVTNISCMEIFKQGDNCKIISGPLKEITDTVIIQGTAHDTWGVDTVEAVIINKKSLLSPALAIYVADCVKKDKKLGLYGLSIHDLEEDRKGVFYYGHLKESGREHCFHPTWLEKIEENAS